MSATAWLLRHRVAVVVVWLVVIGFAGALAARLPGVLQGGADAVPGTESDRVTRTLGREFGLGTLYQFLVVFHSDSVTTDDPRFTEAVEGVTRAVQALPAVRSVETAWGSRRIELLGSDSKSALAVVTPEVRTFYAAERFTAELRRAIRTVAIPAGVAVEDTGATAMLYDLDEHSSSDLLAAERIGLPLTLVILLLVFGAPLAALLPVVLALVATLIGLAGLYAVSGWVPVSVFAENVTSMIGLGVGVDYALFIASRNREALMRGASAREAAVEALDAAGHSVLFSGATVAVGFLALFLVRARFLHTLALGGIFVVAAAVVASMTLLPVLLSAFGPALHWPRRIRTPVISARPAPWARWATLVMRWPWVFLALALAVLLALSAPVLRLRAWNIGARHLPVEMEARRGYDALAPGFARGWMGPVVLMVEAPKDSTVLAGASRQALLAIANELQADPGAGLVLGLPQVLEHSSFADLVLRTPEDLPGPLKEIGRAVVSRDGRVGIAVFVTPGDPSDPETMSWLRAMRARRWPQADAAGLRLSWGGTSSIMADFDDELFGSIPRVMLFVVLSTFIVLMLMFRSLIIPLKATVLNVLSVLAAYGFLVLVFQDGHGARLIGLDPPGGLNSFIVLMLFTILFGLSMDYEVFLLSRVREHYLATGDNDAAVAQGLAQSGRIITSAALIMISIFAAFGFTRLVPTREFGLGLAFAVALDATLIRVVMVPALMTLSGRWNWWFPGRAKPRPTPPASGA